jgi:peroxiredoxin
MITETHPNVEKVVRVGRQAPDFTLPDTAGKLRRLSDQVRHGPLLLVFYRGDW